MNVLGINSFFEHPSAALICDDKLAFAIEEERLTGIKHGKRYTPYKTYVPFASMYRALKQCDLTINDIDEIAYSYCSRTHLKSLYGCFTGQRISSFREEFAAYMSARHVRATLHSDFEIPQRYHPVLMAETLNRVKYREWPHHLCHAASTFYCSGFQDALVVVADGSGEINSTSIYTGHGRELNQIGAFPIPHSLGMFYSCITKHLGFEPFSDESKVMGLAAYGKPSFYNVLSDILSIDNKGMYKVDIKKLMDSNCLPGTPRAPHDPIQTVHYDIAQSAQKLLEDAVLSFLDMYRKKTRLRNLCCAGGTFLNCVLNGVIASKKWFDYIFIQPASHDAGTAIGAAALSSLKQRKDPQIYYDSMALGTFYSEKEIEEYLQTSNAQYTKYSSKNLCTKVASLLAEGKICGLFRGRIEFGPRALGMRTLLASPAHKKMLTTLNTIKGREQFRPVAPLVTEDAFHEYFDGYANRYMVFTSQVRDTVRDKIPAVTHVDGSARVQLVRARDDQFLYDLLTAFGKLTGIPVLINTSLNVKGKPIVENPSDALGLMFSSGLDALVLEKYLVE